jgi:uncharacterized protein (TIGR03437 family)
MALVLSPIASGYYHFVHYLTRTSPYTPVVEKFDLNALPNKTLQYVISDRRPSQLASTDTIAGVISQIRLAASAWNDVASSDLRLAFGGLYTPGTQFNTPVIEVEFGEVPPGLVAYGGPRVRAEISSTGGSFQPILRSIVMIREDLTQGPSWSEGFHLSIAHEFGHAIGLQHSLTSSLMSTEVTRGTTKSRPIAADDIAGVSLLYPKADFAATTGSISGRVAIGGEPAALASVVALSADGAAVSSLTNPDGTYRIDGLVPGSYQVYVHPLPPPTPGVESYAANIFPPIGADGQQLPALSSFETVFYPGVKDSALASSVVVRGGSVQPGVDFGVTRRTAPAVYAVRTYSFPGSVAVKPAHLATNGGRNFILATGTGLTPDASISVVGAAALIPSGGVKPYAGDPRYVQMDFQLNLISGFAGEGPRHLTFNADNDVYVLPSAFRLVRRQPPQITGIAGGFDAQGARQVTIQGTGFVSGSRVLFDGAPAAVNQFDEAGGVIAVNPPPGPSGHRASVVVLNPDGQSSLFLQSTPSTYEYDFSEQPAITVSPSQLAPGAVSMVEIIGAGTSFVAQAGVALGTSDITVRNVWVAGPNRLIANVEVSPQAVPGFVHVTVTNGLRVHTIASGFQIGGTAARLVQVRGDVVDAQSGKSAVPAGATAAMQIASALESTAVQVSVADRPATVSSYVSGQLQFRVPDDLPPGPAIVRVTVGGEAAAPIVMQVDKQPPTVSQVTASGSRIELARPARPGELLTATVRGLGDAGEEVASSRVRVTVSVFAQQVLIVTPINGTHQVQFMLDPATGAGPQTLVISVDGRESAGFSLPVRQ